jgi:hypothetical protein
MILQPPVAGGIEPTEYVDALRNRFSFRARPLAVPDCKLMRVRVGDAPVTAYGRNVSLLVSIH